jgi:hypothetical protein
MGAISIQRSQLAAKIEAVEGSKEVLANTDAFLVFDTKNDPTTDMHKRNPHRETLSPLISLAGKRSGKQTFGVEMVGSGVAGTVPYWGKLLKACGFAETIVGGASVTYLPASTAIPSMTLGMYRDGFVNRIWGARGTFKLALEVGKPGIFSFEFQGVDHERVDAALLTGISYATTIPPLFLGATLTLDSYALVMSKLEITFGNALALRESAAAVSGHVSALITGREPKLTLDPEAVTVATKDFMTMWATNAGVALNCVIGGVPGNIITIAAPKVRIEDLKEGNRKDILTDQISALLAMNAGDDEMSIAIT